MTEDLEILARAVREGKRGAVAKAITLIESTRTTHRQEALTLLEILVKLGTREALRVGMSGAPGVGKSTLINCLGSMLIDRGQSLAVLAVDPSSAESGGSILGDKTRMPALSRNPKAFVRPSPTGKFQGGVSRRARDTVFICEQAGFDVVFVETTGVGQMEALVTELVDVFVLLASPGGGDDLQGMKRGIMELADLVLVNRSDGDMKKLSLLACADFSSALRLMRKRKQDPEGIPKVLNVSALEGTGIESAWNDVVELARWRHREGHWERRRQNQAISWFRSEIDERMRDFLLNDRDMRDQISAMENRVRAGDVHYDAAAETMVRKLFASRSSKSLP
ncbi:MAG: methylmalonyl Co-A mutase-associated GTPase MeaB [Rhodobacteraceae bacterium]|nr:methylmalonyl Co-A mutase-associated GTPase MeaB [Paracoccaceae bacterium]